MASSNAGAGKDVLAEIEDALLCLQNRANFLWRIISEGLCSLPSLKSS